MAKTPFQQLIPLMGRNIPDDNRVILIRQTHDLVHALFVMDDVADLVFVLSGADLLHQVENRALPVNQKHMPPGEQPAVNKLKRERPDHGHNDFRHQDPAHQRKRMEPLIDQRDLKICNHVHNYKRQDLGIDHIPFLIKSHLKTAVHLLKKDQQNRVHSDHQPVSAPPEGEFQEPVIIRHPDKPINSRFHRYDRSRGHKLDDPLILCVILHSTQPLPNTFSYIKRSHRASEYCLTPYTKAGR